MLTAMIWLISEERIDWLMDMEGVGVKKFVNAELVGEQGTEEGQRFFNI